MAFVPESFLGEFLYYSSFLIESRMAHIWINMSCTGT
jgi:hypothetical protein